MINDDLIVAQATGASSSPISIIRASGKNSINILKKIINKKEIKYRYVYYLKIKDKNDIIDDVQVVAYKGPNSYTGEDSFEIFCHGNQIIVNKIINLFVKKGARVAQRGEFTKRAFINNKIDLIQAESIIDIINSRSEIQIEFHRKNKQGVLSSEIQKIAEKINGLLIKTELEIDFNDQEIEVYDKKEISELLLKTEDYINKLTKNYETIKRINNGIKVTICGDVNVGKSTIFNLLSGHEMAIVTEIPGTTRDSIENNINIEKHNALLVDTAGVREAKENIEKEGIERAKKHIKDADIILYVVDISRPESWDRHRLMEGMNLDKTILVLNKIDKVRNKEKTTIEKVAFSNKIRISAINDNEKKLLDVIKIQISEKNSIEDTYFLNERQYYILSEVKNLLINAKKVIETPDLLSYELKTINDKLKNLTGEVKNEEILSEIFSKFCVGK